MMEFQDCLSEFFQEGSQCLCGTLDFAVALESFFGFLRRHVPVTSLSLGRSRLDTHTIDVVASCSAAGVRMIERTIAYPAEAMGMMDDFYYRGLNNPDGAFIRDDTSQTRIVSLISDMLDNPVRPPFFFLRMLYADRRIGSATFTCDADQPFSGEDLLRLRSLRTPLLIALSNYFQFRELKELKENIWQENLKLRRQLDGGPTEEVIGAGGGLREVMNRVRLAGPVDVPVLITGETGTGKEVIAQAVHGMSSRRNKPFVAVNCGGIPPALLDSELFGHVRGAFTGASAQHAGRFERAAGGTLFLDEIGELPLEAQARLLRVLQEKTVERLGGSRPVPVDFRLIAATHRDLRQMVDKGAFREDLYYRLRVVSIHLPPLRERRQDIPLLADHLLRRSAVRFGLNPPPLAAGEMARLVEHDWPGNVRELQNVVEEALVLMPEGPLRFWREEKTRPVATPSAGEVLPRLEVWLGEYFRRLLAVCGGRINGPGGAAERAGIHPSTLRARLRRLGIAYGREARK